MEIASQHPLVSVAVISYNSADYILETLESIKAQTYGNIELVISDDCSSDATVELCRKWIDGNKSRFVDARIVESPVNTGQSGNYNRAFDACKGEWVKEIDGDDMLLSNCVSDFVEYTRLHPEAKYIFGKIVCINQDGLQTESFQDWFDYGFFSLSQEQQLQRLLYGDNCVPSPGSFYCRHYVADLGVRCDDRVPFLEDHPKWINLLRKGVRFYLMDKEVAAYRVGNGISTNGRPSVSFFKTSALFDCYYRYPAWYAKDPDDAVRRIVDVQVERYQQLLKSEEEAERLRSTRAFRLGKRLLQPFKSISRLWHKD